MDPGSDGYEKYLPAISEWIEPFHRIAAQYTREDNPTFLKFNALAAVICHLVLDRIARAEGFSNPGELDSRYCFEIVLKLIEELNNALPLNYPFIVALCRLNDSDSYKMGAVSRRAIPGFHDNLHKNVVPFLSIQAENNSGIFTDLRLKVDFIGKAKDIPEDLI